VGNACVAVKQRAHRNITPVAGNQRLMITYDATLGGAICPGGWRHCTARGPYFGILICRIQWRWLSVREFPENWLRLAQLLSMLIDPGPFQFLLIKSSQSERGSERAQSRLLMVT